jgi:hypothetical protein
MYDLGEKEIKAVFEPFGNIKSVQLVPVRNLDINCSFNQFQNHMYDGVD